MVEFFGAVILGLVYGFVILFVLAGLAVIAFVVFVLVVGPLVAVVSTLLGSKESS